MVIIQRFKQVFKIIIAFDVLEIFRSRILLKKHWLVLIT